jgi:hypothetical protein
MITVPPTTDNSGSPDTADTPAPAAPASYIGPVVAVVPMPHSTAGAVDSIAVEVSAVEVSEAPPRAIRRHRRGGGVWDTTRDRWRPEELAAIRASLAEPDPAPPLPVDTSLAERVARLGEVLDGLLRLTGGERAYRDGGLPGMARRRAAQRIDALDALTGQERDELLLIAIARAAPRLHLCKGCRAATGAEEVCAECRPAQPAVAADAGAR